MVRGDVIAVTAVARTYQCADTQRIDPGRGSRSASDLHASVNTLFSSVFMGLPCPMNTAGIVGAVMRTECTHAVMSSSLPWW